MYGHTKAEGAELDQGGIRHQRGNAAKPEILDVAMLNFKMNVLIHTR
jgi:hypothetical protein